MGSFCVGPASVATVVTAPPSVDSVSVGPAWPTSEALSTAHSSSHIGSCKLGPIFRREGWARICVGTRESSRQEFFRCCLAADLRFSHGARDEKVLPAIVALTQVNIDDYIRNSFR